MTDVDKAEANNQVEQFDEIRADRACIGCGFNLFGQTVTKEDHYGLAICRCPECGTVAALQAYPTMTHWVNRFRALIAAVWIALLLAIFVGSTGAITGMCGAACDVASTTLGEEIGKNHQQWEDQRRADALAAKLIEQASTGNPTHIASASNELAGTTVDPTTITMINGVTVTNSAPNNGGRWTQITDEWIDSQLSQTIESSGGLAGAIHREFIVFLIPMTIVGSILGIFWSIAMLGATRKKVLLIPLVSCLLATVIIIAINAPGGYTYGSSVARSVFTPYLAPMLMAYQFLVFAIGIWIGRKVARWIVVMALPPRNRVPLSLLWTRDGLPLPKPK